MFCPNCGNQISDGASFCTSCGNQIGNRTAFCTNCGTPVSGNSAFCPECGASVNRQETPANSAPTPTYSAPTPTYSVPQNPTYQAYVPQNQAFAPQHATEPQVNRSVNNSQAPKIDTSKFKGKIVFRNVITIIASIAVLICVLFAPMISLSTEEVEGFDIKTEADFSLVQWMLGETVDVYLVGKNPIDDRAKIGTLDLQKNIKNLDLAFLDSDLPEHKLESEKLALKLDRQLCDYILIMAVLIITISAMVADLMMRAMPNMERTHKQFERVYKRKSNKDELVNKGINLTKENYFLRKHGVGPNYCNWNVICVLVLVFIFVYVFFGLNKFYVIDGLEFGVSWVLFAAFGLSLTVSIIASCITRSVEKHLRSMPNFSEIATGNYKVIDGGANTYNYANNADSLLAYKKLLDEGAITQEEYEAVKREILFKK